MQVNAQPTPAVFLKYANEDGLQTRNIVFEKGKGGTDKRNAKFVIRERERLMQSTLHFYIYITFDYFPIILHRLSKKGTASLKLNFLYVIDKTCMLREKIECRLPVFLHFA